MEQLINWSPKTKQFARPVWQGERMLSKEEVEKSFSMPRLKVIDDLVEALTKLWKVTGVSATCVKCFKGELPKGGGWGPQGPYEKFPLNKNKGGCCGTCASLTKNGCASKPVGCAAYICHTITDQLHEEHPKVYRWWRRSGLFSSCMGCYTVGRIRESVEKYSPWQLQIYRRDLTSIRRLIKLVESGRA